MQGQVEGVANLGSERPGLSLNPKISPQSSPSVGIAVWVPCLNIDSGLGQLNVNCGSTDLAESFSTWLIIFTHLYTC